MLGMMVVEGIWVCNVVFGKVLPSFHVVGNVCVWRRIWVKAFPSPSKMVSISFKGVVIWGHNYESAIINFTHYMARFSEFALLLETDIFSFSYWGLWPARTIK